MKRWQINSFWIFFGLLSGSGLLLLWMKYVLKPATEYAVVNHPLQPFILKFHIVIAAFFLISLGIITALHVIPHLERATQVARKSGVITAFSVLFSIIT